jgi:MoaA/NifB/PqqE/SkfB family radical SAM enzyme
MIRLRLWRKDARRLIKQVGRRMPGLERPEQVQIDLTDRCNYRCPTCTKWHHRSAEGELSTAEWKGFIGNVAGMSLTHRIVFAGGEPLLRDDLSDLVAHCTGLGCSTVVLSNGSLLDTEKLRELDTAGLSYLMVSLNSLVPSLHDESRGTEGSWEHLMGVIRAYRNPPLRLKLGIATILMAGNLDQITDLVEFVERNRLHGILFQACMDDLTHHPFRGGYGEPRGDARVADNPFLPADTNTSDQAIDRLLAKQRGGAPILNPPSQLKAMKAYYRGPEDFTQLECLAGVTSFLVDPYGDVRICFGLDPIANVRGHADPLKIWTSAAASAARKKASACGRPCRIMNHIY